MPSAPMPSAPRILREGAPGLVPDAELFAIDLARDRNGSPTIERTLSAHPRRASDLLSSGHTRPRKARASSVPITQEDGSRTIFHQRDRWRTVTTMADDGRDGEHQAQQQARPGAEGESCARFDEAKRLIGDHGLTPQPRTRVSVGGGDRRSPRPPDRPRPPRRTARSSRRSSASRGPRSSRSDLGLTLHQLPPDLADHDVEDLLLRRVLQHAVEGEHRALMMQNVRPTARGRAAGAPRSR